MDDKLRMTTGKLCVNEGFLGENVGEAPRLTWNRPIDYAKKSETDESDRRPNSEGRNDRARRRFGSV